MPGSGQEIKHPENERTTEQKLRKLLFPIFLLLSLLVAISSGFLGYYIGKTGNSGGLYSGQIIDTIVLTGRQKTGESELLYRINILGRVLYTDATPFANGTVELRSEVRYTMTDSQGYFSFENVEEGRHIISVLQDGIVLARASIKAEKTDLIDKARIVRLSDGSYSVLLPLEIDYIDLILRLEKTGDRYLLDIDLNPLSPGTGGSGAVDPPVPDPPPPGEDISPGEGPQGDRPGSGEVGEGNIPDEKDPPPAAGGVSSGSRPKKEEEDKSPGLLVTGETPVSQPWTQKVAVDIFAERPENIGVREINGINVIAPGAAGKYIFKLRNPEKYPLVFSIDLMENDQNIPLLPMRYRLKPSVSGDDYIGGSDWKKASEIKADSVLLAAGKEAYYTLGWKWLTIDDAIDTALGMQAGNPVYILDIIIKAGFE